MPEETTPPERDVAPASPAMPDVENLADSDDANVIMARAKLLEAQAKLAKASTPLFDKIILRGLLPLALAVVGPWALWKFDRSQVEQKRQGETIVQLKDLLKAQREEAAASSARLRRIEEQKAVELASMSAMVTRLDETLKLALVQMAVARLLNERRSPGAMPTSTPRREDVVERLTEQIQLPDVSEREMKRLAGQTYDRMIEQRARK